MWANHTKIKYFFIIFFYLKNRYIQLWTIIPSTENSVTRWQKKWIQFQKGITSSQVHSSKTQFTLSHQAGNRIYMNVASNELIQNPFLNDCQISIQHKPLIVVLKVWDYVLCNESNESIFTLLILTLFIREIGLGSIRWLGVAKINMLRPNSGLERVTDLFAKSYS